MQNSTKSEKTRQTIMRAGEACFSERGFQMSTTAEIAKRAGVAEGTVFLHFSNKLGLLHAITDDFYDKLQADGERTLVDGKLTPAVQLQKLVDSWVGYMADHWNLIMVFMQTAQNNPGTNLANAVLQLNRRYTRLYTGVIDQLKAAGDLSSDLPTSLYRDLIFGTLEHRARGQQYAGKPVDTAEVSRQVVDLILGTGQASKNQLNSKMNAIDHKLDLLLAGHKLDKA